MVWLLDQWRFCLCFPLPFLHHWCFRCQVGRATLRSGGYKMLEDLSARQGRWADSPESAKVSPLFFTYQWSHVCVSVGASLPPQAIPKFIEGFKDQILMSDVALPISKFETFNQFFYRCVAACVRPCRRQFHAWGTWTHTVNAVAAARCCVPSLHNNHHHNIHRKNRRSSMSQTTGS